MNPFAASLYDPDRLAMICDLDVLSASSDPALQALTKEVAASFELPICLLSIVLDEAQYFAAHVGLTGWLAETRGTPAEWSFCRHVVNDGSVLVIEDATVDARTKDNPLVRLEGIASYAGAPVEVGGQILGSLCVIGTTPRHFTADEISQLKDFAARAVGHLETRRVRE